ncbi:alpha-hydroxy acid oxidase [uncultured Propionivibrio sp.]|uniref:alpha-hydroxy acid oxidase n=1 Tax=uncultured Propionivibrio sp. TaxID=426737 RepID=UPI0029C06F87|nr:alpha-hydroxy acid oxidase [uncultured Propionivibrio sp.]
MSSRAVQRCRARYLSLDDFEHAARRKLPRSLFGYVDGATENNLSLRDNRKVFEEILFQPRVLVNVAGRDPSVELFGTRYRAPFGIAPMGICSLTGYRGDIAQAAAAHAAGVPMVLSSSSLIRLEEVVAAAPGAWFQLYVPRHEQAVDALIDRVARAGVEVLVVTVDSAVVPNRENNVRNGFKTPLEPSLRLLWEGVSHPSWSLGTFMRTILRHGVPHFENNTAERGTSLIARNVERDFSGREYLDWGALRRIRARWRGKLVLKGILHPDDARRAGEIGADGIIVSNHGGRQLDGSLSPMRALPAIVAAAGSQMVMIDSGFRRGTDILKAMALGARFVFVGRPFNYAAAVAGEAGVAHAITLLRDEVHADMGLIGINRLDELDPGFLYRPAAG